MILRLYERIFINGQLTKTTRTCTFFPNDNELHKSLRWIYRKYKKTFGDNVHIYVGKDKYKSYRSLTTIADNMTQQLFCIPEKLCNNINIKHKSGIRENKLKQWLLTPETLITHMYYRGLQSLKHI